MLLHFSQLFPVSEYVIAAETNFSNFHVILLNLVLKMLCNLVLFFYFSFRIGICIFLENFESENIKPIEGFWGGDFYS